MRSHRARVFWLLLIILTVLVATPAMAIPIIFTDRAAFDVFAGNYTLLTLDDAPQISFPYGGDVRLPVATYGGLISFLLDGARAKPDIGIVELGTAGLAGGGTVLQPVTALGFDILHVNTSTPVGILYSSGFTISLTGLHFFGVVSDRPFAADVNVFNTASYYVDNIAIKTVPGPSALLLLGIGLAGLAAWRGCRSTSSCV